MKTVILLFYFLFFSISFSQSDEIKLWEQNEPLYGKVIKIKTSAIEFMQDSTDFLFEFDKADVSYIKAQNGDTLWFNIPEGTTNSEDFDIPTDNQNISVGIKRATLFFSYNFLGSHKVTSGEQLGNPDVNSGISFGFEFDFIKTESDVVKIGLGASYQFTRKPINTNGGFNFIPIYAFFKVGIINIKDFEGDEKFKVYLIPAFGYNLFYGEKKYTSDLEINGGFYNSFGFGILIKNKLEMKLLYQFNRGYLVSDDKEIEILYRSLDLRCGYYF